MEPYGIPTFLPCPSGSVLERRQVHHQAVLVELQIFDIQTHQLRPPERPGETHQVSAPDHERRLPFRDRAPPLLCEVLHLDRTLAGLGGAQSATNSFHQLADHGRLGGRVESGGLVSLGNRRYAAGEGRNFMPFPPGLSDKAPRFRAGREEGSGGWPGTRRRSAASRQRRRAGCLKQENGGEVPGRAKRHRPRRVPCPQPVSFSLMSRLRFADATGVTRCLKQ